MVIKLPAGASQLVNYDFLDLIRRIGYGTFYGVWGTTGFMAANPIASQTPVIRTTISSTSYVTIAEVDLDLDVNVPIVLANAPLYVSVSVEDEVSSNQNMSVRATITAYRVDVAAAEHSIGTTTGAAVTIAANVTKSARITTSVTLTETKLIDGEKLRITILLEAKEAVGPSGCTWRTYIDGASRGTTRTNQVDPTSTGSDLGYKNSTDVKILIPFKIQL